MSDWKKTIWPELPSARASVGLLLLRVYAGAALMSHGAKKVQNPFHWMGDGAGAAPPPLQALAALAEFGGGLGLIVGLLTPLAAFGIACTMAVAVAKHISKGDPFVGRGGSWEPALGYLVTAKLLLLAGPGRYALDSLVFRKRAD